MDLITRLKSENRGVEKRVILSQMSELEKKVFLYAYDPYKTYHMKSTRLSYDKLGEPSDEMFELLNKVLNGGIQRGEDAKDAVKKFAKVNGDLILAIVNKDLKCGVTATSFNKVYPGYVPQFKVQLAKEVPIIELQYPLLAQIKYNGVRIVITNRMGVTEIYTRNGFRVSIPKLERILNNFPAINYMQDTEITLLEDKGKDHTSVSGLVNSAIHGGAVPLDDVRFNAFDFMRLSEFDAARCDVAYSGRYSMLMELLSEIRSDHLIPAPTIELHNAEDANDYYEEVLSLGYEGLILKSADHRYTFKRTKDWIKVKETKTADLRCTGYNEASQGKLEGGIGSLICEGIVEGKRVKVDVAGLTMLAAFSPIETYIFKTIEVKYNSIIRNKEGTGWTLFLPRFSCVRFDK